LSCVAWTPALAARALGVLGALVIGGAWLAPLLQPAAAAAATAAAVTLGLIRVAVSLRRQGVPLRELGIRFDEVPRAGAAFGFCALLTLAGFTLAGGIDPRSPGRLTDPAAIGGYALWALSQQFLVVGVLWHHARRWLGVRDREPMLFPASLRLALVSAIGFALLHAPNLRLMALVLGAELVWLVVFARFRNLFALAAVHAVSALAAAEALQPHWLPTARVGLSYLQR
jgi:hypothetical protein